MKKDDVNIQFIQSLYPDEVQAHRKQIKDSILDKHLNQSYPVLDYLQRLIYRAIPYWNTSYTRISRNVQCLLNGNWEFEHLADMDKVRPANPDISKTLLEDIEDSSLAGKNISVFLVVWLPITMMLVANVLHDSPNLPPHFHILLAGVTMLGSMLVISYGMYVYANVMKSPHDMYLQVTTFFNQHLSVSSHVAIVGLLFCIISAATPTWLLVILTIVYACASIYLHFRVYNRSCKPTLLEMLILAILIAVFYISTSYLFYINLAIIYQPPPATGTAAIHQLLRSFHQHQNL